MNLSSLNKTVSQVRSLFDCNNPTQAILPVRPQKPSLPLHGVSIPLPRATPESQGVSSQRIASFLERLNNDPTLNMHSILICRNGYLLCAAGFGAQDPTLHKHTFSACKSVTSLAIGMLLDDGKLALDTKLVDLFPEEAGPIHRLRLKDLTVYHLLTMTAGVVFNEAECMTETDWIHRFFSSATAGDLGKDFRYNSLNTYMLSALVKKVTGSSLSAFLEHRLFAPLGIQDAFWETCPTGIEKGGWGLYIRPEDLAKIGQLVLQKGRWHGAQLISESYIAQATSAQVNVPVDYGDYDYGLHIWTGRSQNQFLFNGMFGQNVIGFPDSGILLVSNAGNGEMFQTGNFYTYAAEAFGGDFPDILPPDANARKSLAACMDRLQAFPSLRRGFLRRTPQFPSVCHHFAGRSFASDDRKASALGLFPVLLQIAQNNFSTGVKRIRFVQTPDRFDLVYEEQDEIHRVAIGFTQSEQSELSFHGEKFRVACFGSFSWDEDGRIVLKLRIDFLETPFSRLLRFYLSGNGQLTLLQQEVPGAPFLTQLYDQLRTKLSDRRVLSAIVGKLDEDYLLYRIEKTFAPKVVFAEE